MPQSTVLNCSQKTAMIVFILIGSLFCLVGCTQFYKLIGLSDQQAADQVAADQADRQQIIEGIRITATDVIITAIAGAGAIASGFLAKWLGTEKKITTAMITGIEDAHASDVKASVKRNATAAGVESQLNARVKALT